MSLLITVSCFMFFVFFCCQPKVFSSSNSEILIGEDSTQAPLHEAKQAPLAAPQDGPLFWANLPPQAQEMAQKKDEPVYIQGCMR